MVLWLRALGSTRSIRVIKDWGKEHIECLCFFLIPISQMNILNKYWSSVFCRPQSSKLLPIPSLLLGGQRRKKRKLQYYASTPPQQCVINTVLVTHPKYSTYGLLWRKITPSQPDPVHLFIIIILFSRILSDGGWYTRVCLFFSCQENCT